MQLAFSFSSSGCVYDVYIHARTRARTQVPPDVRKGIMNAIAADVRKTIPLLRGACMLHTVLIRTCVHVYMHECIAHIPSYIKNVHTYTAFDGETAGFFFVHLMPHFFEGACLCADACVLEFSQAGTHTDARTHARTHTHTHKHTHIHTHTGGDTVYKQREIGNSMYMLARGSVELDPLSTASIERGVSVCTYTLTRARTTLMHTYTYTHTHTHTHIHTYIHT